MGRVGKDNHKRLLRNDSEPTEKACAKSVQIATPKCKSEIENNEAVRRQSVTTCQGLCVENDITNENKNDDKFGWKHVTLC